MTSVPLRVAFEPQSLRRLENCSWRAAKRLGDGFQGVRLRQRDQLAFAFHRPHARCDFLGHDVAPRRIEPRGRCGGNSYGAGRLILGLQTSAPPLGRCGGGGSLRAIGAKATTKPRCDCDSGNLEARAHFPFVFSPSSTRLRIHRALISGPQPSAH